jgi:ADP-ribose pyrophosphatase
MELEEKFIKSEQIFDGKLLKVFRDTVRLPDGSEAIREWIKHPGAVAAVPVLPDGRIILVKQYRYPMEEVTLEIPAGKLEIGENPDEAVLRELKEESGYTAESIELIATIATTVAFSNERIRLYIAKNLTAGEQCTDEDEFINVELHTLDELMEMIRKGTLYDAKTVTALCMIKAMGLA